jgi:pSer/pThr/pTyr-binding forkhead associated (FHA) protein
MTGKILLRTASGVLQEFPLDSSVRIGSGPPSDLVIEGDGVLPEHAKVGVTAQGCWIETVGGSRVSINGEAADRRALRHLDVITLGDHVHAIFSTSTVSLAHASRPAKAMSTAVPPPVPSSTKTTIGLPINAVFTPPVDDQPAASPHKTALGVPVASLFTPPVEDNQPDAMTGDSSANRTAAGLPLGAVMPPRFEAPPSRTSKISPITPPVFRPEQPGEPIRSVRLSGTDGVYDAAPGVSVIGRSSKSTLRIDSVKISRVHAVLVVAADEVTVEDQQSANGTAVNRVRINGRHVLADGDLLSLGSIDLRVTFIREGGA